MSVSRSLLAELQKIEDKELLARILRMLDPASPQIAQQAERVSQFAKSGPKTAFRDPRVIEFAQQYLHRHLGDASIFKDRSDIRFARDVLEFANNQLGYDYHPGESALEKYARRTIRRFQDERSAMTRNKR